jgi:uncharacterized membrane protein
VRPVLVYTASRLGLLLVTLGVLALVGLRDWMWLLILSFLISGVASYVLLSRQRDAMSARLTKGGTSRPGHGTPDQGESYRYPPVDRPDGEEKP